MLFIKEEDYQEIKEKLNKENDYFTKEEMKNFPDFFPTQLWITKNNYIGLMYEMLIFLGLKDIEKN